MFKASPIYSRAMRSLACLLALALPACGSDFQVPAPPDARINLDLAVTTVSAPPDMSCFNTACGGCSDWANWDGTPSKVGDPCLWKGTYACSGTELKCSDTSCLACADTTKHAVGTICGGDGHTIVELFYSGNTCITYDFGSAIDVCNHGAADRCLQRCSAVGNTYNCVAHCASDDGGGTGCAYQPNENCESLAGC
jgi:hypothetical protein